jgi:hypothetical protein
VRFAALRATAAELQRGELTNPDSPIVCHRLIRFHSYQIGKELRRTTTFGNLRRSGSARFVP